MVGRYSYPNGILPVMQKLISSRTLDTFDTPDRYIRMNQSTENTTHTEEEFTDYFIGLVQQQNTCNESGRYDLSAQLGENDKHIKRLEATLFRLVYNNSHDTSCRTYPDAHPVHPHVCDEHLCEKPHDELFMYKNQSYAGSNKLNNDKSENVREYIYGPSPTQAIIASKIDIHEMISSMTNFAFKKEHRRMELHVPADTSMIHDFIYILKCQDASIDILTRTINRVRTYMR